MTSNIRATTAGLYENLDKLVYVLYKRDRRGKESPLYFDNKLNVFLSKDEKMATWIGNLKKYSKNDFIIKEEIVYKLLKIVLNQKLDGILLHDATTTEGFVDEAFISYEDIERHSETIKIAELLHKNATNQISPYETVYNLLDLHFYTFEHMEDTNMYVSRKIDNEDRIMLPIFSTNTLFSEYTNKYNIDVNPNVSTLRNILTNIEKENGVIIDVDHMNISIDQDFASTHSLHPELRLQKEFVEERLKQYALLETFYLMVYPFGNFDRNEGCFISNIIQVNQKHYKCLIVSESIERITESAKSRCSESIEGFIPIGILDKKLFTKVLSRAKELNINYVCFDADTPEQIIVDIETTIKIICNEKLQNSNEDYIPIPLLQNMSKQPLDDIIADKIKSIKNTEVAKFLSTANIDETIATLHEYIKRIKKVQDSNEDDAILVDIYYFILDVLILKINEQKKLNIVINENTGEPIKSEEGYNYILINQRYSNGFQELVTFDFCDKTFTKLEKTSSKVILTNNNNAGLAISLKHLRNAFDKITKTEKTRSEILLYLICQCELTLEEARSFYIALLSKPNLLNEFLEFVKCGGSSFSNKNIFKHNDKSAYDLYKEKNYTKKYMGYLELVERMVTNKK